MDERPPDERPACTDAHRMTLKLHGTTETYTRFRDGSEVIVGEDTAWCSECGRPASGPREGRECSRVDATGARAPEVSVGEIDAWLAEQRSVQREAARHPEVQERVLESVPPDVLRDVLEEREA